VDKCLDKVYDMLESEGQQMKREVAALKTKVQTLTKASHEKQRRIDAQEILLKKEEAAQTKLRSTIAQLNKKLEIHRAESRKHEILASCLICRYCDNAVARTVLTCGHVMCQGCAFRMAMTKNFPSTVSNIRSAELMSTMLNPSNPHLTFFCPVCRENTTPETVRNPNPTEVLNRLENELMESGYHTMSMTSDEKEQHRAEVQDMIKDPIAYARRVGSQGLSLATPERLNAAQRAITRFLDCTGTRLNNVFFQLSSVGIRPLRDGVQVPASQVMSSIFEHLVSHPLQYKYMRLTEPEFRRIWQGPMSLTSLEKICELWDEATDEIDRLRVNVRNSHQNQQMETLLNHLSDGMKPFRQILHPIVEASDDYMSNSVFERLAARVAKCIDFV
jgi:hypothetical protein